MSEGVISLDVMAEGAPAEGAASGTIPTMQGIPASNSVRHSPSLQVRDGGGLSDMKLNPLDAAPKEGDHPGPEDTRNSSWPNQAAEAGQAMIDKGKSIARSTRQGLKEALGNDAQEDEEAYVRGSGFRAAGRLGQEQVSSFYYAPYPRHSSLRLSLLSSSLYAALITVRCAHHS